MKVLMYLNIVKIIYVQVLRTALLEYVQKTDNEWDDFLVTILDRIFNFSE